MEENFSNFHILCSIISFSLPQPLFVGTVSAAFPLENLIYNFSPSILSISLLVYSPLQSPSFFLSLTPLYLYIFSCFILFHFPSLLPAFPPSSLSQMFSVPSISLFGLECFEGREVTLDQEVASLVDEGFNNHVLSVRVNSGW